MRQRCGDSVTADDDANVVEAWPIGFVAPMFSGSNIARTVLEQAPKISQKLRRKIFLLPNFVFFIISLKFPGFLGGSGHTPVSTDGGEIT